MIIYTKIVIACRETIVYLLLYIGPHLLIWNSYEALHNYRIQFICYLSYYYPRFYDEEMVINRLQEHGKTFSGRVDVIIISTPIYNNRM